MLLGFAGFEFFPGMEFPWMVYRLDNSRLFMYLSGNFPIRYSFPFWVMGLSECKTGPRR